MTMTGTTRRQIRLKQCNMNRNLSPMIPLAISFSKVRAAQTVRLLSGHKWSLIDTTGHKNVLNGFRNLQMKR